MKCLNVLDNNRKVVFGKKKKSANRYWYKLTNIMRLEFLTIRNQRSYDRTNRKYLIV